LETAEVKFPLKHGWKFFGKVSKGLFQSGFEVMKLGMTDCWEKMMKAMLSKCDKDHPSILPILSCSVSRCVQLTQSINSVADKIIFFTLSIN
jgi:hypothetical protein